MRLLPLKDMVPPTEKGPEHAAPLYTLTVKAQDWVHGPVSEMSTVAVPPR